MQINYDIDTDTDTDTDTDKYICDVLSDHHWMAAYNDKAHGTILRLLRATGEVHILDI